MATSYRNLCLLMNSQGLKRLLEDKAISILVIPSNPIAIVSENQGLVHTHMSENRRKEPRVLQILRLRLRAPGSRCSVSWYEICQLVSQKTVLRPLHTFNNLIVKGPDDWLRLGLRIKVLYATGSIWESI